MQVRPQTRLTRSFVVFHRRHVDEGGLSRRAGHLADGLAEVVVADGTAAELGGDQDQGGGHLADVVDVAARVERTRTI